MRFRSIGTSASNLEEYLRKIKENENNYIEESTLSYITCISLDEDEINDENEFLGPKSNYKINDFQKCLKRKKGNKNSSQYFRKKIFFHHKRKRINYESINIINTSNNFLEN